jgi:hypothetical protein
MDQRQPVWGGYADKQPEPTRGTIADPWIHRSDNMRCKTCIWFVPKTPSAERLSEQGYSSEAKVYDLGRCRRHAPSMGGYPIVMVNDWCGDHRLDENKFRAA